MAFCFFRAPDPENVPVNADAEIIGCGKVKGTEQTSAPILVFIRNLRCLTQSTGSGVNFLEVVPGLVIVIGRSGDGVNNPEFSGLVKERAMIGVVILVAGLHILIVVKTRGFSPGAAKVRGAFKDEPVLFIDLKAKLHYCIFVFVKTVIGLFAAAVVHVLRFAVSPAQLHGKKLTRVPVKISQGHAFIAVGAVRARHGSADAFFTENIPVNNVDYSGIGP